MVGPEIQVPTDELGALVDPDSLWITDRMTGPLEGLDDVLTAIAEPRITSQRPGCLTTPPPGRPRLQISSRHLPNWSVTYNLGRDIRLLPRDEPFEGVEEGWIMVLIHMTLIPEARLLDQFAIRSVSKPVIRLRMDWFSVVIAQKGNRLTFDPSPLATRASLVFDAKDNEWQGADVL